MTTAHSFEPDQIVLLLPPSEGKAEGGRTGRGGWSPEAGRFGGRTGIAGGRASVADALATVRGGDEKLLGLKGGDLLLRAQSANSTLFGSPTLPAWRRYTGVVWDHLDPASLDAAARRRIVVVSGLLGIVRGDDPVPDYRLKMGASLPSIGKLSTFWREEVTDTIGRSARGRTVIDLLPNEHEAAIDRRRLDALRIELVDPSGKPGGHFAKAAKGRLARELLMSGAAAIERWNDDRFELAVC